MSYHRPANVLTQAVGRELLLVELDGGATYRLNESGRAIFELAETGATLDEIVGRARSTLGGPENIEPYVRDLLTELVKSRLLENRA